MPVINLGVEWISQQQTPYEIPAKVKLGLAQWARFSRPATEGLILMSRVLQCRSPVPFIIDQLLSSRYSWKELTFMHANQDAFNTRWLLLRSVA